MTKTLDELKQEAKELGIRFVPNISAEKLSAKIEEYYESQETSDQEIETAVAEKEKSEEKSVVGDKGKVTMAQKAAIMKAKAEEKVVVTLIDNDTRENNQTTVAVVNCSNKYFDLGTVYIPLNVPVEVRRGHLEVLKDTQIPLHTKDPVSGLSVTRIRPRYTISYGEM